MSDSTAKAYLPRPATARRYNVTERSIARWQADPDLDFPTAMVVNGRMFFAVDELEAWERSRAAASRKEAA